MMIVHRVCVIRIRTNMFVVMIFAITITIHGYDNLLGNLRGVKSPESSIASSSSSRPWPTRHRRNFQQRPDF